MTNLVDVTAIAEEWKKSRATIFCWIKAGIITPEIHIGQTILFDPEKVRDQLIKATKAKQKKGGNFQVPTR